ncbi:unnamed protein product [Caenorhabditis nigoni]
MFTATRGYNKSPFFSPQVTTNTMVPSHFFYSHQLSIDDVTYCLTDHLSLCVALAHLLRYLPLWDGMKKEDCERATNTAALLTYPRA